MTRCFAYGLLIASFSGALCPASSRAQDETDDDPTELRAARFLFSEGNYLTDQKEYERALKSLSLAFELYPAANTAVNIVGLLIDKKDYNSARAWLEYARTLPDLNDRARVILDEFESVIEKHQGRIKLVLDDPSAFVVTIEDKPVAAAELADGVPLDPGRYYLEVKQQDMVTFGTNVKVRAGRDTEVRYKEHTIRRRQPSTAQPAEFAPPKLRAAKTEPGVAPSPPAPPPKPANPVFDEPWFRGLVAIAATMTILSTALLIHEL